MSYVVFVTRYEGRCELAPSVVLMSPRNDYVSQIWSTEIVALLADEHATSEKVR